jgi:hypothetical protein
MALDRLIFVDCEASGPAPGLEGSELTEFGAVHYITRATFYGRLWETEEIPETPEHAPVLIRPSCQIKMTHRNGDSSEFGTFVDAYGVFYHFRNWIQDLTPKGRPATFITDNLAFDWQWINYNFHLHLGENPFGYSGRRVNDFYAGLVGDFVDQSVWKRLRVTPHTHQPVDDAMGNLEAFERMLKGERA